ncbi:DNA gyrase subunit A [Myxacorys almedinensis]|uniref:DNA topoisomerase (ATP-hydrolyzing) n=1 Tax=Myxacorys almedinensis A TaxID=2690445 RepID=A0A8J8CLJ2_9CYAN|nr:DNA gyrase subunit A [Myxacorys almedinensis]NDJ17810.1 DNA gyrase subunit A [Myxacorys almedinensis A]
MAKQLNILPTGQVITTALHTEMQQSYLEYAMSVIVGRALPDVRDGLKPVHRRILYAMHELGLTPDRPYRKCARVVGDVLGKYHPHGDQSVYDALVRLVQDFSSRYPLLAGHGNFGSVDNDPPAAMRYTETRLAAIGNEGLLSEIGEATVDFVGNFDNSQQEPTVLPAQLPFLILNGSSGIAVGMATNIPPHNLNEVVDGLVALIDRPMLSDDDLLALIPGPDFPTGGEIIESSGVREAYLTGRGSIPVRGITNIEEVNVGRGKHRRTAIIITELPYQVNKASLIEKIADLVNQGKIEGIGDLRDESDRDGIRVVIELRRDVHPHKILSDLYRQTALQSNFGAILLAIENGQPKQMTLRELLQGFLDFREVTLTRQYRHEFEQAEHQLHLVEGRLMALSNLDEVIGILRHAPDGGTAKLQLQEQLDLSDRQADAILSMPLRRLTALEHQSLQTERDELAAKMQELNKLLNDRRELLKALKKDLRSLKKQHGDHRRTRILSGDTPTGEAQPSTSAARSDAVSSSFALPFEFEEEVQEAVVEITQRGYVRRMTPKSYERQSRNRNDDTTTNGLEDGDDFATHTQFTTTGEMLVVFTRNGKAYPVKVQDIPQATGKSKGTPLVTLLPAAAQGDPDTIAGGFILPETLDDQSVLLLTGQGRIKRLALSEFSDLTGRGLTILKLKDEDQLLCVSLVELGEQVILATSSGRVLRFKVDDVAIASRSAQGAMGMRVGKKEAIIGWAIATQADTFLMVSQQGYAKQMKIGSLRAATPGELGTQVFQFTNKTDILAGVVAVLPEALIFLLTNENHLARIDVDAVEIGRKDDKGDRIVKLGKTERLTSLSLPILFGGAAEEPDE